MNSTEEIDYSIFPLEQLMTQLKICKSKSTEYLTKYEECIKVKKNLEKEIYNKCNHNWTTEYNGCVYSPRDKICSKCGLEQ